MKPAQIHHFTNPLHILTAPSPNTWHHNPSITQNWISSRFHPSPPRLRDMRSSLALSSRTTPTDWRVLTPPAEFRQRGVEDVRLFERVDGLYGVGARVRPEGISQVVIRVDTSRNTYEMVHDYGTLRGRTEKNWSPPSIPSPHFDFIYSPTEIVRNGQIIGSSYSGPTHGGSQLLPYGSGWLSIAHRAVRVAPLTELWYVQQAQLHDYTGYVTQVSQFFDFGAGWRQEDGISVEFVSGAVWDSPDTLLLSLGVRDDTCALVKVPISAFEWYPALSWFSRFSLSPSLLDVVESTHLHRLV